MADVWEVLAGIKVRAEESVASAAAYDDVPPAIRTAWTDIPRLIAALEAGLAGCAEGKTARKIQRAIAAALEGP